MPPPTSKSLTERQRAVMVRIDRRVPIKVIARELGVSDTRINQHIRALKNIYSASSLGELVEGYRADLRDTKNAINESLSEIEASGRGGKETQKPSVFPFHSNDTASPKSGIRGLSESAYSKSQVEESLRESNLVLEDDLGKLTVNDVMPMIDQAPWLRVGEPKVVPGALDGEHATLLRFGAIIVIAFGFLAAIVLAVTAAMKVSEALDGKASIPAETQG